MIATTEVEQPTEKVTQPNLAGSIGKNTLFGVLASVVQVGTRVVTVPIVLAHLGLDGYGIWSVIMNVGTYMRFGSVGIKSAFQKYVAEATGSGDYERAGKLLSTGSLAMLVFSVAGLVPTAIFSRQIAQAAGIPPQFLHSSAWAITVLAIIMVLSNSGAAYEAMVMGGHRIDLTRKFATVCYIGEAVGFIVVLRFGYGLFAMASIMAASDLGFLIACYFASRRVVPEIHVNIGNVAKSVLTELVRFAGSYQVLSILQIVYLTLTPVVILRSFGANATGLLALSSRLTSPIAMCMSAFMLPILSGGAMVYASGSMEKMQSLLAKSFKVTLGLNLIPLAVIAIFGTDVIQAWTGQTDPSLQAVLGLICLSVLFQSFSLLGLVLYRVSGRALMDNLRELLRIACFLPIAYFARRLGLYGVLWGMAATELIGVIFIMYALTRTFVGFRTRGLIPDALKVVAATVGIVAATVVAVHISPATLSNARMLATMHVGVIGVAILLSIYPALYLTGALSKSELQSITNMFRRKSRPAVPSIG